MKRVLITGANSYVGTNVEKWLMKEPDKYYVETLDMKDPNWIDFDFSKFDVVFHVAGIAHVSTKKSMKDLYFKVNRDLTIETAEFAKKSGVKQFIFMSSMIIYNSKETAITSETKPIPDNFYGLSKIQAEEGILNLKDSNFNISILRPPMIYGPNSKGNFNTLIKFSSKLFILPKLNNSRSILYINNLSNFIKLVIDRNTYGYLYPRNIQIVSTNDIIFEIRKQKNKKNRQSFLLGIAMRFTMIFIAYFRKIYGDRYYKDNIDDQSMEMIQIKEYNKTTFMESVGKSIE